MLKEQIFELFWSHDSLSKAEVMAALSQEVSDASVKRALQQLVKDGKLLLMWEENNLKEFVDNLKETQYNAFAEQKIK